MKSTILTVLMLTAPFLESASADPPTKAARQAFRKFEKTIEAVETELWKLKPDGNCELEARLLALRGAIWTGNMASTPEGAQILSEMATGDQLCALKREVSRLTHDDRSPRRWSNRAETSEIEAALEAYDLKTGIATLKLLNESTVRVQIGTLCDYDRDWIKRRLGTKVFDRPPLRLPSKELSSTY